MKTIKFAIVLAGLSINLKQKPNESAKLRIIFNIDLKHSMKTIMESLPPDYHLFTYGITSERQIARDETVTAEGYLRTISVAETIATKDPSLVQYQDFGSFNLSISKNNNYEYPYICELRYIRYKESASYLNKESASYLNPALEVNGFIRDDTKDLFESLLQYRIKDSITNPIKLTWCYDKPSSEPYYLTSQVCESALPNHNGESES